MRLRRIALALASLAATAGSAQAQIWEKLIFPGFTYRMEVDLGTPRLVHAIRFSPGSPVVAAVPELGKGTVFQADPAQSRATLSEMVRATGAIGGLNADFFPWSGDPIGLMAVGGEIVSAPYGSRAVIAWGQNGAKLGTASFRAAFAVVGSQPTAIDGLNEEASGDRLCLNTSRAGYAMAKGPALHAVIEVLSGEWRAGIDVKARVQTLTDVSPQSIAPGTAVLTATGARVLALQRLNVGDELSLRIEIGGVDLARYPNAVSGGPFLVRNAQISIDWAAQGFNEAFAMNRHPRTAAGITKEGDVWFVTIDGRQAVSAGATLEETARIMLRLGCVEAVNLDGGGSTTLNLFGVTVNRPSGGAERAVANAILFQRLGVPPPGVGSGSGDGAPKLKIRGPESLRVGQAARFEVLDESGRILDARQVVWSASNGAWIDQGGLLRPLKEGLASVVAWTAGRVIVAAVEVLPARAP